MSNRDELWDRLEYADVHHMPIRVTRDELRDLLTQDGARALATPDPSQCRLHAITYVHRCRDCGKWWTCYADQPAQCSGCGSSDYEHASTVDPRTIIERWLNGDPGVRGDLTEFIEVDND